MTALAIPDQDVLTSASNTDIADYMSALYTYFNSTSAKFSIVANGGSAAAFTITPVDADESWHLNFRMTSTTLVKVCLDPLGNITDPGDSVTAPTLTDSSEWSEEGDIWEIAGGGAEDVNFYVIELDDCVFVLHMNATTKTHTPRGIMCGRTWIPFNSDGVNGDNYADGLGIHGPVPYATNGSQTGGWFSSNTTTSRIRMARTGGFTAGDPTAAWYNPLFRYRPTTTDVADIQGGANNAPGIISGIDTAGSGDSMIGYTKYLKFMGVNNTPGVRRDGASGDEWIHYRNTATTDNAILPWKPGETPEFS